MLNELGTNPNFQEINLKDSKRISSLRAEEINSDTTQINTLKLPDKDNKYEKTYEEDTDVSYIISSNEPPDINKTYIEENSNLFLSYSVSNRKITWEPLNSFLQSKQGTLTFSSTNSTNLSVSSNSLNSDILNIVNIQKDIRYFFKVKLNSFSTSNWNTITFPESITTLQEKKKYYLEKFLDIVKISKQFYISNETSGLPELISLSSSTSQQLISNDELTFNFLLSNLNTIQTGLSFSYTEENIINQSLKNSISTYPTFNISVNYNY